jgi:geranylgeranyl diphosphate synthase type II
MDIKKYLNDYRLLVEKGMEHFMLKAEGELADHIEAMRYSLFAGGKRIRPILCLAAAESVTDTDLQKEAMVVACALEYIHTYSLIHDDLPAMDDDDLRRGKPTNHKVFGEAEAILAGDGLLSFAFELLSGPSSSQLDDHKRIKIIHIISHAIGPQGMVGGQALDIGSEGKNISFETLRSIHSRKTGALITAAVQCGAVLAGADDDQFNRLTEYGNNIGLAFQITDDLLNVEGTPEQLGKAAGSDAARDKATYPSFFGVEETRVKAAEAVQRAIDALQTFDRKAWPLRQLAHYIRNRNK